MEIKEVNLSLIDSSIKEQLLKLWNSEYPENLFYPSLNDFDNYLSSLFNAKHYLLTLRVNNIQGWAFTFDRENEKWFGIIISETMQGKGYGTLLLRHIFERESELNGWVIEKNNLTKRNSEIYKSPLKFYLKNKFVKIDSVRLETEKLTAVKIKWKRNN